MKYFSHVFLLLCLSACNSQPKKINGVSYVASDKKIDQSHINPVAAINANYAAIMPFAYIKNLNHPEVRYNGDRQWFGETEKGVVHYIKELRKQNIRIMLKPQIWVWRGEFTGYIEMKSEDDWQTFESTYSKFILNFARIAQETKSEIFCIGTELELFIKNRPEYWSKLIKEIRGIYSGKLTYAANWDEFKRTPFWSEIDYIGLDAYFPVSDKKTPLLEDCIEGWKAHKPLIAEFSKKYNKPILFTEFGYRSVDFSGKEPWVSDRSMNNVNLEAQVNTTKALFETFWAEEWFAGGFVWKWFHDHKEAGGIDNSRFTPQNKPVEKVIAEYYMN